MIRLSSSFVRTLREDPADAEVASHRLLVRAGCIRRSAAGVYTWLPLGLKVLRKVEQIVREEQDAIGGQEVLFSALQPREPYERTGRWEDYGPNLFRLQDRRQDDYLLAPTHEEMFTLAVKDLFSSYKDLPTMLYQIQSKYRDEARPRAGLLRTREFIMKDAYSFDATDAGLDASYEKQRGAYQRTFDRLGLPTVICRADAGAMGGSRSEEFLHPTEVGEDTFVVSDGGYAANVEAVETLPPPALDEAAIAALPAMHVEDTPGANTIAALTDFSNQAFPGRGPVAEDGSWTRYEMLKHLVYLLTHPDGSTEPLVIAVPGDREVDPKRLEAALSPAVAAPFTDADFARHPVLAKGYIGPAGLGLDSDSGIRYLVDPRVVPGSSWVAGAGEAGKHVYDLVFGRDFTADGTIEAAEVRDGDPAPDGSGPLRLTRGMEMGHIFQLGRKYAEALDLTVLDENGKAAVVTMGSYGIGVTRAVAAIAELNHDEKGLCWPRALAPADVHIVATGKGQEVFDEAERIAAELEGRGIEVLYDDRPKVSPGVKFKDSELLGVPTSVVIGRGLASGTVELRDRVSGEIRELSPQEIVEAVVAEVRGA
ncbi:proline--tRNA ligase [Brachybacterium saurashtrense]|uniref:Proline--tRNA ligase n=1 Tax=Brachybacterium saurashtrense TaxID=556288 RepID=A0A345YKY1_9MICO|nr:proline--tRNA ligase [Brachybacterium saurashtrense]AXK44583.1 proline--tRNA ligase [Brachybacterium saurashtrense]RRR23195.1 proline--tRNA ligase [Brachybacterium saurashtrense]